MIWCKKIIWILDILTRSLILLCLIAYMKELLKVELSEGDSLVEMYCAAEQGLLLSTVKILDALGLYIQQYTSLHDVCN